MNHAASKKGIDFFNELVDSIEELLKRISDVDSPEIEKIRTKAQVSLAAARSAWQDTTRYANQQVTDSLRSSRDYLRESPWRTVGVATVVGIAVGALLISKQRGSGWL
jgi:ElaB/YqjD/DUF883 family membrane-anchored ribosome-binding protein